MLLKGGVRLSAYAALLSLYIFVLESEEKQMKKKKNKTYHHHQKHPKQLERFLLLEKNWVSRCFFIL